MKRIAIYPGSFDPLTNGHLDIIRRGSKLVDQLVVSVAINTGKEPMFGLEERLDMLGQQIAVLQKKGGLGKNVEVASFDGLLIDYAKSAGAKIILRGLRAMTDFDYEFQMTGMNHRMNPDIETVFLMASETHQFISSRMVKEIAMLGGDISGFVTPDVAKAMSSRCKELASAR